MAYEAGVPSEPGESLTTICQSVSQVELVVALIGPVRSVESQMSKKASHPGEPRCNCKTATSAQRR